MDCSVGSPFLFLVLAYFLGTVHCFKGSDLLAQMEYTQNLVLSVPLPSPLYGTKQAVLHMQRPAVGIMFEYDISDMFTDDLLYNGPSLREENCSDVDTPCQQRKAFGLDWMNIRKNYTDLRAELRRRIGNNDWRVQSSRENPIAIDLHKSWIRTLGGDEDKWAVVSCMLARCQRGNGVVIQFEDRQSVYDSKLTALLSSYIESALQLEYLGHDTEGMIKFAMERRLDELTWKMRQNIEHCTQRRFPVAQYDKQLFSAAINRMEETLVKQGITLDFTSEDFLTYLTMPIADCFFTSTTMRVFLNLPTIPKLASVLRKPQPNIEL